LIVLSIVISLFTFNSCEDDDTSGSGVVLEDIVVQPTRAKDTILVGESVSYEFGADTLSTSVVYAWLFEGGTPNTSFESNPTINYTEAGTYGTGLTLTRIEGGKKFSGSIPVNLVVLDTAMSSFVADARMIDEGGQVKFMNTGTAEATLVWTFEGGTPATSTEQEVDVTYATSGMYAVTLEATLNGKTVTNMETDYIEVTPIVASFTATATTIDARQTVTYTNTSNDGATLLWTFTGGDITTSTEQEVTVTYDTPGTYDVTLEATKNGITRTVAETGFVTVNVPPTAVLESANTSADGKQVILAYDLELDDPSGETITVAVNGADSPVATIALDPADAKKIIVTLTTAIASSTDMVTATYSAPAITTSSGGPVTAFTDQEVTNNFVIANLVSAETSLDGVEIILTYDLDLNDPSAETFTVSVNGVDSPVASVSFDAADATKIGVVLATAITSATDVVTVTYSTPGINTTGGGAVAALTDQAVVNNFTPTDAVFVAAETSRDGTQIIIEYDQRLTDPSAETITASVNGMMSTVTSIALDPMDAKKIVVTLTTAIASSTDMVTVTYSAPGINTLSGGVVAALMNQAVVNNFPPNLFATGDFEGVTDGEYHLDQDFFGGGAPANVIVATLPDGVGVASSRALVYTVTGATSGDRRDIFGDKNSAAIQRIEPVTVGTTYTVKAMFKFTGVKPDRFVFAVVNLPFAGPAIYDANMDISAVVAGADFVEVTGTFTVAPLNNGNPSSGTLYPIPRLIAGTGDAVITVDNIRVFENE